MVVRGPSRRLSGTCGHGHERAPRRASKAGHCRQAGRAAACIKHTHTHMHMHSTRRASTHLAVSVRVAQVLDDGVALVHRQVGVVRVHHVRELALAALGNGLRAPGGPVLRAWCGKPPEGWKGGGRRHISLPVRSPFPHWWRLVPVQPQSTTIPHPPLTPHLPHHTTPPTHTHTPWGRAGRARRGRGS